MSLLLFTLSYCLFQRMKTNCASVCWFFSNKRYLCLFLARTTTLTEWWRHAIVGRWCFLWNWMSFSTIVALRNYNWSPIKKSKQIISIFSSILWEFPTVLQSSWLGLPEMNLKSRNFNFPRSATLLVPASLVSYAKSM